MNTCLACSAGRHRDCLMRKHPRAKIKLCGCWCLDPARVAAKVLDVVAAYGDERIYTKYADVIEFLRQEAKGVKQ